MAATNPKDLELILKSDLFDGEWYESEYPDVAMVGMSPVEHFYRFGGILGRDPSLKFNSRAYIRSYSDVAKAGVNPLVHFLKYGRSEGRTSSLSSRAFSGSKVDRFQILQKLASSDTSLSRVAGIPKRNPAAPTILLVAHIGGDKLFGGERSFVDVLEALFKLGYNVVVTTPGGSTRDYLNILRLSAVEILSFPYGWWLRNVPINEYHVAIFAGIISEYKVTAVHVNTLMVREPLQAARHMNVPSVVHVRELINNDPALCDVIGETPDQIVPKVLASADYVISNSNATGRIYRKEAFSYVIPNTVDTIRYDIPHQVLGLKLVVSLISSNLPKKGIFDFVDVANRLEEKLPHVKFRLVGPITPEIEALRVRQDSGEISSNLEFPGYAEDPLEAIRSSNIIVNFSNFEESFGRTVLEAMAAGRPVVVYEWGALPELVDQGITGFTVPFRDTKAAADKIGLLCADPDRIVSMGMAARRKANQYSYEAFTLGLGGVYERILRDATAKREAMFPLVSAAKGVHPPNPSTVLRVAYFCWHFPVPSETFVLNELRYLVEQGIDVQVYCRQSPHKNFAPDFPISWKQVKTPEDLAEKLLADHRTIAHGHFVYPTVTDFLWPACELARIPFTFIAHAQDIFRHTNDEKNRIGEIAKSTLCKAVFVLSNFHRDFVAERGVPQSKIIINPNAVDTTVFEEGATVDHAPRSARAICAIHRFAKKKGLENLIKAAPTLATAGITIDLYGYGAEESQYRQLISDLGITNVRIMGELKGAGEIVSALEKYDLFACPSIRTEDGDMDGIPTSIIEAMAAKIPVLATDIAGIPDLVIHGVTGIITSPDAEAIAKSVISFYAMPESQVRSIIKAASERAKRMHDVNRLGRVLRRVWTNETIDIVVIGWKNYEEHAEVLRRIYEFTSLPFHVIVCANADDEEALTIFNAYAREKENFTLIRNGKNAWVGPATNQAIDAGWSDTIIYVCGREGFVFKKGWEIPFVHHMAENPEVGQAGMLCHSPTYLYGKDYPKGVRLFEKFRNRSFAETNKDREFFHIQGGFFAIRRTMYDEIGGFSKDVPHDYTDVEFSYYVESCGWKLGEVDGLVALFNKTRPDLKAYFDRDTKAAHPPTLQDLPRLDLIANGKAKNCNLCGWFGDSFVHSESHAAECPECGSQAKDRSLYSWLAPTVYLNRRLPALAVGLSGNIEKIWATNFQGPRLSWADFTANLIKTGRLSNRNSSLHIAVVRLGPIKQDLLNVLIKETSRLLVHNGILLVQCEEIDVQNLQNSAERAGFEDLGEKIYSSESRCFDFNPLRVFKKKN